MKEMQAIKMRRAYESSAFIYCLPESPFPSLRSWVITAGQHRCLPAWEQVPQVWRGWTGLSQRGLADGPYTPQWVDRVCCYRNQSPLRAHEEGAMDLWESGREKALEQSLRIHHKVAGRPMNSVTECDRGSQKRCLLSPLKG